MANPAFNIGDKVKMTGKALKSMGLTRGSAGQSVWTVTGFDGRWVVTNEPSAYPFEPHELEANPTLAFRRIAKEALQKV